MNIHVVSGDAYGMSGGNDRRLVATVSKDGAPVVLDDVVLTFMVKRHRQDEDDDALITRTTASGIDIAQPQTGDTAGVAYITLTEAHTGALAGKYFWEMEADDAVGKITLASGGFYVASDLIEG